MNISDVIVKDLPEMKVASVSHVGPYWELFSAFEALNSYLVKNSIKTLTAPMGLYLDNPKLVPMDQLRSEAVIGIENGAAEGNIQIKALPAGKFVTLIYTGSYADPGKLKAYEILHKYIEANGLKYQGELPVREVYLNSPSEVKPDELKTEIQFPIQ